MKQTIGFLGKNEKLGSCHETKL